jgi:hypothetical protein
MRYTSSQQAVSEAVDLRLSFIDEDMMLHRTWQCGRMDVLFAPPLFRVDPKTKHSKLKKLLEKESKEQVGGSFGALRFRLSQNKKGHVRRFFSSFFLRSSFSSFLLQKSCMIREVFN